MSGCWKAGFTYLGAAVRAVETEELHGDSCGGGLEVESVLFVLLR